MIRIKPFRAVRPPQNLVQEIAARPYDVLNSKEAKAEAGEKSLLHITKPEIDFDPIIDEHLPAAYDKAVENFKLWQDRQWLQQDTDAHYYIYAQTMAGRTQYGLMACAHIDDYLDGKIKKHELTRKDKEEDRMLHVRIQDANIEPVFFAYQDVDAMNQLVAKLVKDLKPDYDFVADDGFGHHFWVIRNQAITDQITNIFEAVPALYVADGHHRTAAAALVGQEKKAKNPHHNGTEEYNYFMAVIFPESHLKIIDYNRLVHDLNGLTTAQFLTALKTDFEIKDCGTTIHQPQALHNFGLYVDKKWYSLTAKSNTYNDQDPIAALDVTVLSECVLDKLLNIGDLRVSKRIDFVGGIRGLAELQTRVDKGEAIAAFALFPVSMKQLIDIADTGNIMPPKTTWFEPKLRSGLAIHKLS